MKPIEFEEANSVYGDKQPQYQPLSAHKTKDGNVVSCWELSEREIAKIVKTKRIWLSVLTFNKPLQPVLLSVNKFEWLNNENKND